MTTFHHLQIELESDLIGSRCSSRSLVLYNRPLRGREGGKEREGGREKGGEKGKEGRRE